MMTSYSALAADIRQQRRRNRQSNQAMVRTCQRGVHGHWQLRHHLWVRRCWVQEWSRGDAYGSGMTSAFDVQSAMLLYDLSPICGSCFSSHGPWRQSKSNVACSRLSHRKCYYDTNQVQKIMPLKFTCCRVLRVFNYCFCFRIWCTLKTKTVEMTAKPASTL